MKIVENRQAGVYPLRLDMDAGGRPFVVMAALLQDEKDLILVDTGIAGQTEVIRAAMEREGFSLDKLTGILITHQDRDHVGSLPALVKAFGGKLGVLAHETAVPFLQGEVPLLKSGTSAEPVTVTAVLRDGDVLPYAGGIEVVYTPGHTPDHISLYHRPSQTLISGDALTSQDGVLMPPDRNFTLDWEGALASVSKLSGFDVRCAITYHCGVCTEGVQERLAEIARG